MAGVNPLPQIQVGFNFQMSFGEEWKWFYFILLMQQEEEDKHETRSLMFCYTVMSQNFSVSFLTFVLWQNWNHRQGCMPKPLLVHTEN